MAITPINPGSDDWTRPAVGGFTITASANALASPCRGLYLGAAGNVTCTMQDGTSIQFIGLAAGMIHPIAVTHVTAATATGILGLY